MIVSKLKYFGLATAIMLAMFIIAELYHLLIAHWMVDQENFQQVLLNNIRTTATMASPEDTEKDLVEKYNAVYITSMSKESISSLPKHHQGRYMSFTGELPMALNWNFYTIAPVLNYNILLEIGSVNGKVEAVRITYSAKEK